MPDNFTCDVCGGTFPRGPEGVAEAELLANFGDVSKLDCDVVCDDCYKKVTGFDPVIEFNAGGADCISPPVGQKS